MTPRNLGAAPRRIDLGFATALLLVAAAGTVAYSATHRLGDAAAQVSHAHEILSYTERALSGLVDAETSQLGYVITGDTAYLAPWRAAAARIHGELRALHELSAGDPLLEARLSALNALAARRLRLVAQTIETRRTEGLEPAAELARSGQAKQIMDAARALVGAIQRTEQNRLDAAAARAADIALYARVSVAAGLLMAFLLVLGGMLAVRRELRVRRRAEVALRENQAQLQQFMDTLPIGTFIVDAGGRATFANTTALTMLGRDSLARQDGLDALPLWRAGADRPVPREESPLTLALRGLAAGADTFELRSGTRALPVEIFATPVFDSAGHVAYAIATISDVTERKRHQAALRAAKEAAEHASQAKSDFLARMSHELRTPLNAIIGFANILVKKSGAPGGRERTYAERILENGKHLLVLINDILDLARIEAGRLGVERQSVALDALIDEVLRQWEASAAEGGAVRLEASVPPHLAPIQTDPLRLRQVLVNLVGNAMKFTGQGSVRVTVETVAGSDRPGCIRVTDTGIGIAPERIAAIFEAFEQAETSTSRRFGGTGLGLAISRALCQALGYRLSARSEPGAGSEFSIELEPELAPPRPLAPGDARRLALVLDEHPASRARLVASIEALGCRAVAAASDEHALHLAHALQPALVVLRPAADAHAALAFLARLHDQAGLRELMVVALADAGLAAAERTRLREAGALVIEGGAALEAGLASAMDRLLPARAQVRP
ncbi:MAG TPA: CHASE3 domain-containing protein [Longimicrobiales bacterium]|nr:CHASE3 domain-containing protein [Longimicrobiales bacterium]